MPLRTDPCQFLDAVVDLAREAGRRIMAIYASDFRVGEKDDRSPLTAAELAGRAWQPLPATTALGALLSHITGDAEAETFQPMNVNFGLFPPLHDVGKKARKEAYTSRAKADLAAWIAAQREAVPA